MPKSEFLLRLPYCAFKDRSLHTSNKLCNAFRVYARTLGDIYARMKLLQDSIMLESLTSEGMAPPSARVPLHVPHIACDSRGFDNPNKYPSFQISILYGGFSSLRRVTLRPWFSSSIRFFYARLARAIFLHSTRIGGVYGDKSGNRRVITCLQQFGDDFSRILTSTFLARIAEGRTAALNHHSSSPVCEMLGTFEIRKRRLNS